MKLKLTLIIALSVFTTCVFAQAKKGSVLGLHFNLADFKGPTGIKDPVSGKVYSSVREMDKGFSLSYWKGLTSKIDFSGKVNAMYLSNIAGNSGKAQIGLELEPTLNVRPFKDGSLIAPFLTAGIGGGMYNKEFGAYVPVGFGAQVNFSSVTYIFVQAQRKFTLTKDIIGDNLFYSFGVAQSIGGR
jgi:hypothetical protein